MKYITTYQSNGKIIGCFNLPENEVELMVGSNLYIEELSDPKSQYVDNNCVVDFPTKPEEGYDFDYQTKTWKPNINSLDILAKNKRNVFLTNSDWTDTASAKVRLGDILYNEWQAYRQALRDITKQELYPITVNWPTPPN